MRLQDWEVTIQTIADECNRVCTGADKVLMAWRVKLAKEPNLLQPFQIDGIVREVRQRLVFGDRRSAEQCPLPVWQRHEVPALPQQGV